MAKALVPLAEGFEDIEAVTIIDVLRRGGVEVVTASLDGVREVTSAHGLSVKADATFAEVGEDDYEAIVLPGGPGTPRLRESEALVKRLRRQKEDERLICAICAAPTVLTGIGIVDPDLHVTCYPSCAMELDRPCADVPVVVDGNFVTGQAPGSALLFALVVLRTLAGDVVAAKVARGMVTDALIF